MKKITLLIVSLPLFLLAPVMSAQEGIGTNQPHKSAALHIQSEKRGLLIPRFDIPDLENPAPVNDPADALLVFNTGTSGTTKGFYYWDKPQSKWIALAGSSGSGGATPDFELIGQAPIQVTDLGGDVYEIGLTLPSNNEEGQVLVTQLNADNDLEAVWVEVASLFGGGDFTVENGLQWDDPDNPTVLKWGGMLTEDTTIDTDGNELTISGLDEIDPADLSDYKVVIMDDSGLLKLISSGELGGSGGIDGDLEADNALHIADDKIMLGGALIKATAIGTDVDNTLAIEGLQDASSANKWVVAEDNDGILRSVTRVVSGAVSNSGNVSDLANYSPYVPEVNIEVDINGLSSSDIDLQLPDAGPAEGQVINIRLSEGNEADHYLNIKSGSNTLTYGALPFQGWIIKSMNGNWLVVARN